MAPIHMYVLCIWSFETTYIPYDNFNCNERETWDVKIHSEREGEIVRKREREKERDLEEDVGRTREREREREIERELENKRERERMINS